MGRVNEVLIERCVRHPEVLSMEELRAVLHLITCEPVARELFWFYSLFYHELDGARPEPTDQFNGFVDTLFG